MIAALSELNCHGLQHKFLWAVFRHFEPQEDFICTPAEEKWGNTTISKHKSCVCLNSIRLPGPSRVPAAGSGASRSPGSSNLNRRSQSFNSIDKGKPLQYASGNDRGESGGKARRGNEGCVWAKISGEAGGCQSPSILNPDHLVAPLTQADRGWRGSAVWLTVGVSVFLQEKWLVVIVFWLCLGCVIFYTFIAMA